MALQTTYDIIITGGGAGGLSFIASVLASPFFDDKRVLVIDRDVKSTNDKTWCYWSEDPLPYPQSHVKAWGQCEIGKDGAYVNRLTGAYKYREINSLSFYHEIHHRINRSPNVDQLISNVLKITPKLEKCVVETEDQIFESEVVINSIPGLMQPLPSSFFLTQNFKGIRIRTDQPVFNETSATLMDFFQTQDTCESAFFYVLPYSPYEALVEYTRFSKEVREHTSYDPYLTQYLNEKYGVETYEILETEIGVIPMTDFPYQTNPHPRVFQIGTVAGDTKPTTGYTFHFIQKRAQLIVNSLSKPTHRFNQVSRPARFRFYDRLLLSIMVREPQKVKDIMFRLFSKVPLPLILKFLDEKTTLWEEMKIFLKLPKLLFISAIFIPKPILYANTVQTTLDRSVRRAL